LAGISVLAASGCSDAVCKHAEERRISSPNGQSEIVLIYKDCGATTSLVYTIFVVGRGLSPNKDGEVARLEKATKINVEWHSDSVAEVSYAAREARLTKSDVMVRLQDGTEKLISIAMKPI
jgi:hypothetical protein